MSATVQSPHLQAAGGRADERLAGLVEPLAVVTDCLSRLYPLGCRSRPALAWRRFPNAACSRSEVPSGRQRRNRRSSLGRGGYSCGSRRLWLPVWTT
jgi:hypothetical protein